VATARRCSDGWVLGDSPADCHLGVVAAFPAPETEQVLWRPVAGARVLGVVISAVSLVGLAVYLRGGRGRGRRRETADA
jgi:hypothetical protein